jgi:hypothetical protein
MDVTRVELFPAELPQQIFYLIGRLHGCGRVIEGRGEPYPPSRSRRLHIQVPLSRSRPVLAQICLLQSGYSEREGQADNRIGHRDQPKRQRWTPIRQMGGCA